MYGTRARIGYTSPLLLTEVFTYEFYMVAPKGVTLILSSGVLWESTRQEVEHTLALHIEAAKEMAKAGASLVVLGGIPINLAEGFAAVDELIKRTERACGVPVTTSVTAQIHALSTIGAKEIGVVQIQDPPPKPRPEDDYLSLSGFHVETTWGVGSQPSQLGRLPSAANSRVARALAKEHPQVDTLYFPGPHRAVIDQVDSLEQELGMNVVTASQAIFWEALRRSGIEEPIPGFGRLFREF